MAYTERQVKGGRTYLYRVRSVRRGRKVVKERVYLGPARKGKTTAEAVRAADRDLGVLSALLTPEEERFLTKVRRAYEATPASTRQNRYEAFASAFTYNSNAIEGNTLTLQETSQLLFDGIAPAKSTREINEALNHKRAFDHIISHRGDITRRLILDLHELVVRDTLPPEVADQAGAYRTVQVYIRGVDWVPAAPREVPRDMKRLLEWYTKRKRKLHPVVVAAYFHVGFELVHPFVDGNGRVGRLLLNFILHRGGYPMVSVPRSRRSEYFDCLEAGQVRGDLRPFLSFLIGLYGEPGPTL